MKNRKILIAYDTKLGSTEKIAQVIGHTLKGNGAKVDVRKMGGVTSLTGYDAVIIGGPIRYDQWIDEVKFFVKTHHSTLATLPHSAFFSCLTLARDTPKATAQADTYAAQIAALFPDLWPNDVGQFAGVLDYTKMPVFSRLIAHVIFAFLRVPAGDYRNESAIRAWAARQSLHLKM